MRSSYATKLAIACSTCILFVLGVLFCNTPKWAHAAEQPATPAGDVRATATALVQMQQNIFATQTAIAMTLAPPATTLPTVTPRPTGANIPRPTSTPASRPQATVSATKPASVTSPSPTAAQTSAGTAAATSHLAPVAEILMDGVNLRTGPGTSFPISGSANGGQRYPVVGQADNCAWLQIMVEDGTKAWLTGATLYTKLDVGCRSVPAAQVASVEQPTKRPMPAQATAKPTEKVTVEPTSVAREVAPTPTAKPVQVADGPTSIIPIEPGPDIRVNGPVTFAWTPDAQLNQDQVFELVFWSPGQSFKDGRALNSAAATTTMQVNVSNLGSGPHSWGVYLASAEPYSRLRFLGEGGAINVASDDQAGGTNSGGNSSQGGGGTDQKEHGGEK